MPLHTVQILFKAAIVGPGKYNQDESMGRETEREELK